LAKTLENITDSPAGGGYVQCPRAEYEQQEKKFGKMSRGPKKQYDEWLDEEKEKLKRRQETVRKLCQREGLLIHSYLFQSKILIEWEIALDRLTSENKEIQRLARREVYVFLCSHS
jgi:hypothetical protein